MLTAPLTADAQVSRKWARQGSCTTGDDAAALLDYMAGLAALVGRLAVRGTVVRGSRVSV